MKAQRKSIEKKPVTSNALSNQDSCSLVLSQQHGVIAISKAKFYPRSSKNKCETIIIILDLQKQRETTVQNANKGILGASCHHRPAPSTIWLTQIHLCGSSAAASETCKRHIRYCILQSASKTAEQVKLPPLHRFCLRYKRIVETLHLLHDGI